MPSPPRRRHPHRARHPLAWPVLAAAAAAAAACASRARMPSAATASPPSSSFFAAAQQVHVPRPDNAWQAGVAAVLPPTLEVRRDRGGCREHWRERAWKNRRTRRLPSPPAPPDLAHTPPPFSSLSDTEPRRHGRLLLRLPAQGLHPGRRRGRRGRPHPRRRRPGRPPGARRPALGGLWPGRRAAGARRRGRLRGRRIRSHVRPGRRPRGRGGAGAGGGGGPGGGGGGGRRGARARARARGGGKRGGGARGGGRPAQVGKGARAGAGPGPRPRPPARL